MGGPGFIRAEPYSSRSTKHRGGEDSRRVLGEESPQGAGAAKYHGHRGARGEAQASRTVILLSLHRFWHHLLTVFSALRIQATATAEVEKVAMKAEFSQRQQREASEQKDKERAREAALKRASRRGSIGNLSTLFHDNISSSPSTPQNGARTETFESSTRNLKSTSGTTRRESTMSGMTLAPVRPGGLTGATRAGVAELSGLRRSQSGKRGRRTLRRGRRSLR